MCGCAPHSGIEANVDRHGRASPWPVRGRRRASAGATGRARRALAVATAALLTLLAGCTETCLLNGECPGDEVCLDGQCRTPCTVDLECPLEQFCLGGGCRSLAPGERPPCREDTGCPEPDAMVVDLAVLDRAVDDAFDLGPEPPDPDAGPDPDAAPDPDAGRDGGVGDMRLVDSGPFELGPPDLDPTDGDPTDGGLLDGGSDGGPDGGAGVDLTGLYAVTTAVVVATGGALASGDELRRIHHLTRLDGTRHRVEVYTTDGAFEHRAEADFASPDGPGRYQFEYALPVEAPEGCEGVELRFQRGRYDAFEPGWRLVGAEERAVSFEGPECAAEGYLVRVDATWIPLPPP